MDIIILDMVLRAKFLIKQTWIYMMKSYTMFTKRG